MANIVLGIESDFFRDQEASFATFTKERFKESFVGTGYLQDFEIPFDDPRLKRAVLLEPSVIQWQIREILEFVRLEKLKVERRRLE